LPSLQKGILDATTVSLKGLGSGLGTGAVLKYITRIASVTTDFAIVMNKNKWNSLPADLQKILTDEGNKLVQEADEIQVNSDPELKKEMIARFNLQFNTLPQTELDKFQAAAEPIIEKSASDLDAKGLPGTDVLNAYLQLEQKYSDPQYAPNQQPNY
jgi:TRAP-type C4-dicarboxylate transport system substrate-binding protein